MNINHFRRMEVDLRSEEIDTFREIVRLANTQLINAPATAMKGCPLVRQAGLVGPELFRVELMLRQLAASVGLVLLYGPEADDCQVVDPEFVPQPNTLSIQ